MLVNLRRVLAVGTAAALSLLTLNTAASPAQAAPQACDGVWVVAQPSDAASATVTCATSYADGIAATTSAGHVVDGSNSEWGFLVSQIDAMPENPDFASNGGYFWGFCTAEVSSAGVIGPWVTSGTGASDTNPAKGTAIGWRLTNSEDFTAATVCPQAVQVPEEASPSPTPTETTTASPSPTPTETITPTPTPTPTPTAPATGTASVAAAATWLNASVPSTWDGAGSALDVGLALATQECTFTTNLTKIRDYLAKQADSYSKTNPVAAGKLAIFATAVGDDPTDFGGVNLVKRVLDATEAGGRIGSSDFSFGQALAMIGLGRTGSAPTEQMVTYLLGQQLASGAWGFGATSDPDSTALALIALSDETITPTEATKAAVAKAVAWAASSQQPAGYWENFSPVDSTSLLGSALKLHGVDTSSALAWLGIQQLTNGAFSNSLNGKEADQLATANALYLLSGVSLATVSAPLAICAETDESTDEEPAKAEELANTGANAASLPIGLAGIGLVALGGVALILRRERQASVRRVQR